MTADPYGTAGLRRVVLDAWRASPDRFREDANAEEDAALGAYRDRVVVELAQNAADAAARTGSPGRLLLRLEHGPDGARLVAANTGEPLDAAGVRALGSLRASAKRSGAGVGRFGVGAASVLSVSDDAVWASAAGAVRFCAALTRDAVAALGDTALDAEVAARGGAVPVLRLPFPDAGPPAGVAEGYDTAVVLALRDDAAVAAVAEALEAVDDALLLALPALAEVRVDLPGSAPRVLRDAGQRWHLLRRSGALPPHALAGLGVEERARAERAGWSLTWALPRDRASAAPAAAQERGWADGFGDDDAGQREERRVLHAPTPTDDVVTLPALLVADLPLDPDRRRVPDTEAARTVLEHAGAAYADLLAERAASGDDVLPLVPVGLAAGWVDGVVRAAAVRSLRSARVLRPAVPDAGAADGGDREGDGGPLRPDQALALDDGPLADDPAVLRALAPLVAGLVDAPRRSRAALAVLEVRRLGLAEVADALPHDPADWTAAASALAAAAGDPAAREQLAALRVPLAGGRVAVGARGLLVPDSRQLVVDSAAALGVLAEHGVRLLDPLAAADAGAVRLVLALGAVPADARDLLADAALADAVTALDEQIGGRWEDDDGEPAPLSAAVLDLAALAVADGRLHPGDLPALAALPLPSADGEVLPVAALVVPGSPAADLLDPEAVAPPSAPVLERWGADVLAALGAARSLAVLAHHDVDPLDPPEALADQPGAQQWLDDVVELGGEGCSLQRVSVVRDLDLLRAGVEGPLLVHLAGSAPLRAAVVERVTVVRPDGSEVQAPSPSATWLGEELGMRGCAAPWCDPGLAAVLPAAPAWARPAGGDLDHALGEALGLVTDVTDLDPAGWQRVLDDAARAAVEGVPPALAGPLGAAALLPLWRALAGAAAADPRLAGQLRPPSHVLALDAAGAVVAVPAEEAVVVDDPCWVQRTDLGPRLVPGERLAAALADVVATSCSSEVATGTVGSVGEQVDVPEQVRAVLGGSCPASWSEHDELLVDGVGVDWWVDGRGPGASVHAATSAGLARALALAAGRWEERALVDAVLADPGRAATALLEDAAGGRP